MILIDIFIGYSAFFIKFLINDVFSVFWSILVKGSIFIATH
ncbi:hypothetical protein yberc0001_31000 [Yersinia bercovieri ATCC 43970]|uniref:Uncharacterized protein n=1 Tax=Yersinia bercovieri ATCC 43970 TaxID=349968 RepID=A0ABM9XXY5_YERBE|nr:hypothetical protein yberc0001_31000 [Yersinia bercovieri ATCC 43970]